MSKLPVAALTTEGRVFGTDWSIANVATLVRANAGRGMWRNNPATAGGYTARLNQNYLRTVSARHLPTAASLIFMKLEEEKCWYASLCFVGTDDYLPWNGEAAELWLGALFGQDRPRVVPELAPASTNGTARQFRLG